MAYVYRHIRRDTGDPFYIGIGYDAFYKRARARAGRNASWNAIANTHGFDYEIMIEGLTEDEARDKEKEFIELYGRMCSGCGILTNMTRGGDGLGPKMITAAFRDKISKLKKGVSPSEEAVQKRRGRRTQYHPERAKAMNESRSNALKGRKLGQSVIDQLRTRRGANNPMFGRENNGRFKGWIVAIKDGVVIGKYRGVYACADGLGIQPSKIGSVINGKRNHTGGYTFKRISAPIFC